MQPAIRTARDTAASSVITWSSIPFTHLGRWASRLPWLAVAHGSGRSQAADSRRIPAWQLWPVSEQLCVRR